VLVEHNWDLAVAVARIAEMVSDTDRFWSMALAASGRARLDAASLVADVVERVLR
jgi:hypothetical protein